MVLFRWGQKSPLFLPTFKVQKKAVHVDFFFSHLNRAIVQNLVYSWQTIDMEMGRYFHTRMDLHKVWKIWAWPLFYPKLSYQPNSWTNHFASSRIFHVERFRLSQQSSCIDHVLHNDWSQSYDESSEIEQYFFYILCRFLLKKWKLTVRILDISLWGFWLLSNDGHIQTVQFLCRISSLDTQLPHLAHSVQSIENGWAISMV